MNVGNPGNVGGPGRPASAIRELCRGAFGARVRVLETIADGEPVQRIEVPLGVVLRSAQCPKCGEGLKAEDADALLLTVEGRASASPGDRIKAVDTLGKYGLDARTQLAVDEVRDRLVRQLTVIRQALSPEAAETLIEKLREVWKT